MKNEWMERRQQWTSWAYILMSGAEAGKKQWTWFNVEPVCHFYDEWMNEFSKGGIYSIVKLGFHLQIWSSHQSTWSTRSKVKISFTFEDTLLFLKCKIHTGVQNLRFTSINVWTTFKYIEFEVEVSEVLCFFLASRVINVELEKFVN